MLLLFALVLPLLVSGCPAGEFQYSGSNCCPAGKFSSTGSYVNCASSQTVTSTRGVVSLMSTGSSGAFQCQVLLAPNISLGTSSQFSVRMMSYNAEAPVQIFTCDKSSCDSLSVTAVGSYSVFTAASMIKVVFSVSALTRNNVFLMSWESNVMLPVCSDCANLIPLPSGANYFFNGDSCLWQCNQGYYIPTGTADAAGRYITTGPVSCAACTACPSGQYTDPLHYDGGCWGIASNNQVMGFKNRSIIRLFTLIFRAPTEPC